MRKTLQSGWIWRLLGTAPFALLAGCTAASPEMLAANDPYEPTNRQIFALNQQLDAIFFKPTVQRYLSLPEAIRTGLHNVLRNLAGPTIFVNEVLQAEPGRAGRTAARFMINSSVGLGGIFDPASRAGFAYHGEDFGQTLAIWGAGEGPYLMLPLLGPSNPRDTAGLAVDTFILDPTNYLRLKGHFWWDAGRQYLNYLDLRSQTFETLQGIERSSVDYYAALRSLYRQSRDAEIRNGAPARTQDLPDF
ncbi:MAG: VacJ family lipoprotein [Alphaproteobacteria bacterium]|nr:VacJ family lipoprotein [Alphaproteobacteria bacterium]